MDLAATNASIRVKGLSGNLFEEIQSLYWRVRITDTYGERKTRKIPLRLNAQEEVLALAETRIVELAAQIQEIGYTTDALPWDVPKFEPITKQLAIPVAQGGVKP